MPATFCPGYCPCSGGATSVASGPGGFGEGLAEGLPTGSSAALATVWILRRRMREWLDNYKLYSKWRNNALELDVNKLETFKSPIVEKGYPLPNKRTVVGAGEDRPIYEDFHCADVLDFEENAHDASFLDDLDKRNNTEAKMGKCAHCVLLDRRTRLFMKDAFQQTDEVKVEKPTVISEDSSLDSSEEEFEDRLTRVTVNRHTMIEAAKMKVRLFLGQHAEETKIEGPATMSGVSSLVDSSGKTEDRLALVADSNYVESNLKITTYEEALDNENKKRKTIKSLHKVTKEPLLQCTNAPPKRGRFTGEDNTGGADAYVTKQGVFNPGFL